LAAIKIYRINCTKSFQACAQGSWFSLTPWGGGNCGGFEGYDDGGKSYVLPDDYEILEEKGGGLQVIHKDSGAPIDLFMFHDRPALMDNKKGVFHVALKPAEANL
jgi:hypothetical protein